MIPDGPSIRRMANVEEDLSNARVDEYAPTLFALRALERFFIELGDLVVWFNVELGELSHSMFEDLVVQPA